MSESRLRRVLGWVAYPPITLGYLFFFAFGHLLGDASGWVFGYAEATGGSAEQAARDVADLVGPVLQVAVWVLVVVCAGRLLLLGKWGRAHV